MVIKVSDLRSFPTGRYKDLKVGDGFVDNIDNLFMRLDPVNQAVNLRTGHTKSIPEDAIIHPVDLYIEVLNDSAHKNDIEGQEKGG